MKKLSFILCCILLLSSCTYFTINNALEMAEKGNYIQSLNIIHKCINDEYAIKGFQTVYPKAEDAFKTQITNNKNTNLTAYTKALYQLLYIQNLYLKIPDNIKNKMKISPPSLNERDEIKRELANSLYKLGKQHPNNTYFDKLHTYGLFKEANIYNIDNKKEIIEALETSRKNAIGIFLISINSSFDNIISSSLYPTVNANLLKYPVFKIGTSNNYNITFNVSATNFSYIPSEVKNKSDKGTYSTTVAQNVMKKVVETEYINGKKVETTKWTPSLEDVEIKIDYQHIKYTKTSTVSFDLSYNISEKNGNVLYSGVKKISATDKVEWNEYYPLKPIIGMPFLEGLRSEPERFNISKEQLMEKAKIQAQEEIKKIIETLYSSQKVSF